MKMTSVIGILVILYITFNIVGTYVAIIFDDSIKMGFVMNIFLSLLIYWFVDVSFALVKKMYNNIVAK
jgi:hypothetical protein